MKQIVGNCVVVGALLVGIIGLAWIIQGNDWFMYRVFAPRYEAVRRETFEQSKAYRQGMEQELQNMQFEYIKADAKHKAALASIILHRAADYDEALMSSDLRRFISELRTEMKEAR